MTVEDSVERHGAILALLNGLKKMEPPIETAASIERAIFRVTIEYAEAALAAHEAFQRDPNSDYLAVRACVTSDALCHTATNIAQAFVEAR